MPRIRTVKPDFCTSLDVGQLSRDARLFFLQLLTECDDEGRTFWIPKRICGVLYPHDEDVTDAMIQAWADECQQRGMVVVYDTLSGKALQVCNWSKHQKISHPAKSRIPPPPEVVRSGSGESPETLRPDLGTGNREQGTGRGRLRASRLPENQTLTDDWRTAARSVSDECGAGLTPGQIENEFSRFCDHWRAAPGQKGVKSDWLATWRNWIRRSVDYSRGGAGGKTNRKLSVVEEAAAGARAYLESHGE